MLGSLHLSHRSSFAASRLNQHVFQPVSLLFRWHALCWTAVQTLMRFVIYDARIRTTFRFIYVMCNRLNCCTAGHHCMSRLDGAGSLKWIVLRRGVFTLTHSQPVQVRSGHETRV